VGQANGNIKCVCLNNYWFTLNREDEYSITSLTVVIDIYSESDTDSSKSLL